MFTVADAGALQDLRRGDGAGAQQHFLARTHAVVLALALVLHTDRRLAFEQDDVGGGTRLDGDVGALLGGIQIAACGGGATAFPGHEAVHRAEAFLLVAVDVFGGRVACLDACRDEGMVELVVALLGRGDRHRAVAAMVVIRADIARLALAEVGQALTIVPVGQDGVLGPVVVIQRIAADVAHAVDQRGAAQALAAATFHATVVHVRLGIGLEVPVVALTLQRVRQRGGHLGAEVEAVVAATGFQQQHTDIGVFAQAGGQHVAGAAGADDDVVVFTLELAHGRSSRIGCHMRAHDAPFTTGSGHCRAAGYVCLSVVNRRGTA